LLSEEKLSPIMKKIILILLISLVFPGFSFASSAKKISHIRVLIQEDLPSISLEVDKSGAHITAESGTQTTLRLKKLFITSNARGIGINGQSIDGNTFTLSHPEAQFTVKEKTYAGNLTIAKRENGHLDLINTTSLERYLIGILGSEMSPSWPIEALKAQAVAARSYAYASIQSVRKHAPNKLFDLRATVMDQVYNGISQLDARAKKATEATENEVLFSKTSPARTYFHSLCGGRTESADHVWKNAKATYFTNDNFCRRTPRITWEYNIPKNTFIQNLHRNGFDFKTLQDISVITHEDSLRVDHLLLSTNNGLIMVKADKLRQIFGYTKIRSTWFNIGMGDTEVIIAGRGFGHGVGMCQWGAKGMAEAGYSYKDILKFYYGNAMLKRLSLFSASK